MLSFLSLFSRAGQSIGSPCTAVWGSRLTAWDQMTWPPPGGIARTCAEISRHRPAAAFIKALLLRESKSRWQAAGVHGNTPIAVPGSTSQSALALFQPCNHLLHGTGARPPASSHPHVPHQTHIWRRGVPLVLTILHQHLHRVLSRQLHPISRRILLPHRAEHTVLDNLPHLVYHTIDAHRVGTIPYASESGVPVCDCQLFVCLCSR